MRGNHEINSGRTTTPSIAAIVHNVMAAELMLKKHLDLNAVAMWLDTCHWDWKVDRLKRECVHDREQKNKM